MKKQVIVLMLCLSVLLMGCGAMDSLNEAALDIKLMQENVYTLSDGTQVDLWVSKRWPQSVTYRIGDVNLMEVDNCDSLDEVMAANLPNWHTMDEQAQENILAWYADRGAQYTLDGIYGDSLRDMLETAYAYYQLCQENGEEFEGWYEGENIVAKYANEDILVFETTVKGGESWSVSNVSLATAMRTALTKITADPVRTTEIFDRHTGVLIPMEDLFTVSREEAEARLTVLYNAVETKSAVEHVYLEYLLPQPNNMAVAIPQTINDADHLYYTPIDYTQIEDILQPWVLGLSE